jgi:hypothetical protein
MAVIKWGARRQILYYAVAIIIVAALGLFTWQTFFTHEPTCFDRVQNGTEQGVDCGGTCALLCQNNAKAPTVLWARSFENAPGSYTAVAYLRNNNVAVGAGARNVRYIFSFYDEKNVLITEREGVLNIPPVQTVPVVELNVDAGTRAVSKTFFKILNENFTWEVVPKSSLQQLRLSNISSYNDNRVTATLINDSFDPAKRVRITAVLFNTNGVAYGASHTTVGEIAGKSSESIVFTWPSPITASVYPEVIVLPSF